MANCDVDFFHKNPDRRFRCRRALEDELGADDEDAYVVIRRLDDGGQALAIVSHNDKSVDATKLPDEILQLALRQIRAADIPALKDRAKGDETLADLADRYDEDLVAAVLGEITQNRKRRK